MLPSVARSPRPEAKQDAAYKDTAYDDDPRRAACFSVVARAEPGVLPRVMELFAKRGLVPSSWHSTATGRNGGENGSELTIDIQMRGMAVETADFIAAKLRQIADVETVLTSQKR
jgi:acetolactate synthase small subunit